MGIEFTSALVSRNYSAAIKCLDTEIKQALDKEGSTVHKLLCNRAYCYEQLQLHRRAAKVVLAFALSVPCASCKHGLWKPRRFCAQDYEEAINRSVAGGHPSVHALVQQGLLLHRLKKGKVRAQSSYTHTLCIG